MYILYFYGIINLELKSKLTYIIERVICMATLASLRKVRGLSVSQVAEHMGVTERTIYSWERGERIPSIYDLYRLMSYYKTDALISEIPSLIPKMIKKNKTTEQGVNKL